MRLFAVQALSCFQSWSPSTKASSWGYVQQGPATLRPLEGPLRDCELHMETGMWFASPWKLRVRAAHAVVVESAGASRPLFQLGGPVLETQGRRAYIDGISETQIVRPTSEHEGCLHFMHMPRGCKQRRHSHPSHRVVYVVRGSGLYQAANETTPVDTGDWFVIEPGTSHSFSTSDDASCDLVTWHPDASPDDADHMLRETLPDDDAPFLV